MNMFSIKQNPPKSQAELIYEAQTRRERQFRANVATSWLVLIFYPNSSIQRAEHNHWDKNIQRHSN
ncbi:MAG: hypothetical protein Q7T89_09745 [Anaerolineales bacterium]|nr:hypothetical protein [Anaerolineales bacterium]